MSSESQEIEVTGAEVAGMFETDSEEALTQEERNILSALLRRGDRVDLSVPDNMDPRELWSMLELCSRTFLRARQLGGILKLLIGRALIVIQKTPEIYESRGFRSFDAFMSDDVRGLPAMTGISRPELFKAKLVAGSSGPDMNLDDARKIGFTKMHIVCSVETSKETQKVLMEAAKTDTIPQLRERIARSNLQVQSGDITWDVLQVTVTQTQKRLIQQFMSNPLVRAYCESESPGMILERMIQEVSEEWSIRAMVIEGEAVEV